jgi:hypothetical protein
MQEQTMAQDDKNTEPNMQEEILSFNNDNLNEPRGKTDIYKTSSKEDTS